MRSRSNRHPGRCSKLHPLIVLHATQARPFCESARYRRDISSYPPPNHLHKQRHPTAVPIFAANSGGGWFRAGCITVRLEPLENRNSPRIPTKACPASHRCSLLGSGVIRGLKPPRPCIFPHVDFISCAWTALLGNQSITVRTVGVRGGVEQLQRSCTTSPKLPYHALE